MRINSTNERPIKLNNEDIENVPPFTYLGSVIAVDAEEQNEMCWPGLAKPEQHSSC